MWISFQRSNYQLILINLKYFFRSAPKTPASSSARVEPRSASSVRSPAARSKYQIRTETTSIPTSTFSGKHRSEFFDFILLFGSIFSFSVPKRLKMKATDVFFGFKMNVNTRSFVVQDLVEKCRALIEDHLGYNNCYYPTTNEAVDLVKRYSSIQFIETINRSRPKNLLI